MGGPLQGIKAIWADERWKENVSDPAPCFLESELLGCTRVVMEGRAGPSTTSASAHDCAVSAHYFPRWGSDTERFRMMDVGGQGEALAELMSFFKLEIIFCT